jgi:hypothetical protein
MNIIIEDAETLKYFTDKGSWTTNANEGKNYASATLALIAARQEPIGKFNITGYVDQTKQLVNLRSGRGTGSPSTSPE